MHRPTASRGLWLSTLLILTIIRSAAAQDRATLSTALNQTALQPGRDAVLAVVLDIEPGFHAQSSRPLSANLIPFKISIDANPALEPQKPLYPAGTIETYPQLGTLSVYSGRAVAYIPIRVKSTAAPGPITLSGTAEFQICDDQMCFQPETPTFKVETQIVPASEVVEPNHPELFADLEKLRAAQQSARPTRPSGTASSAAIVSGRPKWTTPVAFGAAFLAGLLFNIMPCVLPVLPIKAKGFYEVAHHRRSQAFFFGLVFSLGLISVFAVLALIVLVFRWFSWGALFSEPWFIWPIVVLLLILSLGLFGSYDVNLPVFVYSFTPRHDTYTGNFFWGALMAILATPCTAPLLPALLLWASAQSAAVGVPAMVMVGVGMAFPYLILSAFPELAAGIPRSGPAAELFRQMLGFMMLSAAAYFAGGRLVHGVGFWWIVVAVVAVAASYLLARTVQIYKTAMPVAVSAVLSVAMLGGMLWWTARINGMLAGHSNWRAYSTAEFAAAREAGKPVLVKFTANWCATCQVIEGNVYQESRVWDALRRAEVVAFKVDLTDADAPGKDLLLKLNPAGGIPLTAIYPARSEEPIVLASIYTTDALLDALNRATEADSQASLNR